MSKANYQPPSLIGNPTKALVPPGKCQFTEDFVSVPLLERIPVSSTSSVLRFGLPDTSAPLNLSTCACILAKAEIAGEAVVRPYTPISTNELKGCFDLLVKDYGPSAKMSRLLCEDLKVGETVDFKHISFNVKLQAPFKPKKVSRGLRLYFGLIPDFVSSPYSCSFNSSSMKDLYVGWRNWNYTHDSSFACDLG